MRLLASFHGVYSDKVGLLHYQKNHWGMREGDTCVIELLGLSAAGLHINMDRKEKYRAERLNTIRRKLTENTPKTVVMYGFTGETHFQEIAGAALARGKWLSMKRTCLFMLTIQRDNVAGTPTNHGMISEFKCEQVQVTVNAILCL